MEFGAVGTSTIGVTKSTTGKYGYDVKVAFIGHDLRTMRNVAANVCKIQRLLEEAVNAPMEPTKETADFLKSLGTKIVEAEKKQDEKK